MKNFIKGFLNIFGLEINTIKGKQRLEYKNEIKRLRDVGQRPFASIVDIGANTGQFARHARVAFPEARIISFEPVESCYTELVHTFSGDSNFRAYNCAIGKSNRKTTFYTNEYAPSSSMLEIAEEHIKYFPNTENTTATVIEEKLFEEVVDIASLEKPCLVKIDVQGYELEIISNNDKLLSAADVVIVETSFKQLYQGQPLFDNVYQSMLNLGFVYGGSYDQLNAPGTYQPIQSDSIFYRVL